MLSALLTYRRFESGHNRRRCSEILAGSHAETNCDNRPIWHLCRSEIDTGCSSGHVARRWSRYTSHPEIPGSRNRRRSFRNRHCYHNHHCYHSRRSHHSRHSFHFEERKLLVVWVDYRTGGR